MANSYFDSQKFDQAESSLKQAFTLNPNYFSTVFQLSKLYYTKKEYELAEYYLLQTIQIKDDIAGIFSVLGIVQKELGKLNEAEQSYLKAVQLNPNFYEAYYNLGLLFYKKKQITEAVYHFNKAIELNRDLYLAFYNLGNIYREFEKYDEAVQAYSRTIQIKNDFADAYYNIGVVYEQVYDQKTALQYYQQTLTLDPAHVDAHWNRSIILLLLKNYDEGFEEYEWRKKRAEYPKRIFLKPELISEEVNGKKIFVYDDQGLGDTIQFSRYLPMLKKIGTEVIFECDKKLIPLFNNFHGVDQLKERENTAKLVSDYDYHISLLSLPRYFKTSPESIPNDIPYIFPDKNLVNKWKAILGESKKVKVGLVWAGNPNHTRDKHRSIKLEEFSSLLSTEGVEFFSLQKFTQDNLVEEPVEDIITKLAIETFADTAAIIENLDLVISVDTSVAHLAGAMGKPVWNLIYHYPDWRWSLEGSTTPWYPAMKLFRQSIPMEWKSVLKNVKQELEFIVQQKNTKKEKEDKILYTGLAKGNNFGWGVCSNYLKKELSKKITLINIDEDEVARNSSAVDGTVLHALVDIDMNSLFQVRGTKNIGYAFFESELTPVSHQNITDYDLILVGSTWCKNKLEQAGIKNADVLIQGIDHEIFYPSETETQSNYFRIFSGGKFELRKGQDLVLKAIKILQQKYDDIVLVNAWYNFWPKTMLPMSKSNHIKFELIGNSWEEYMLNLYKMNSMDAGRILTFPLVSNLRSRELYMNTDIGLFPNRAEGGTNLVLMEYMACGKPVVASFSSGHKDIITNDNALQLTRLKEYKLLNGNNELIADWEEADVDEITSQIEYAYFHRDEIKKIGNNAAMHLKQFTWEHTANNLLKIMDRF